MNSILIIDDEQDIQISFCKLLGSYGYKCFCSGNSVQALQVFNENDISVVILDLKLGNENGIDVLKKFKEINPQIPIIIVTAYGNIPTAVEAIKLGAFDFISKPPEFGKLNMVIKRAIENYNLKTQVEQLDSALEGTIRGLLGKSKQMHSVVEQIRFASQSDFAVILQGETGTGKTYIADLIHNLSNRSSKPFVKVDIGAIPESLVENELFGHDKGAFSGADKRKKGFFEVVSGGTIFIDEIENISPYVQSKLLSVVDEKKIYPLGMTKQIDLDFKIICATNSDIEESVQSGKFREDLYYRLGEFIISIPPLRSRSEDILFLAQKFLLETKAEMNKNIIGFTHEAMELLIKYNWPGNIRELRTVIRKAVLFTNTSYIEANHINFMKREKLDQQEEQWDQEVIPMKSAVQNLEKSLIKKALDITNGNKLKSANLLEMNYKTFRQKIKEYELDKTQ